MATNIQEIFGLQENILINLIQENLRNCAFAWTKISPMIFQTNSLLINGVPWDVRIQKIPLPSGTRYNLEILKCDKITVTVTSSDNSLVGSLFDTAEEMFSPLQNIEDEAISVLCGRGCTSTYDYSGRGGVVAGGVTLKENTVEIGGGIETGGKSSFDGGSGPLVTITFLSPAYYSEFQYDIWAIDVDGTSYVHGDTIQRLAGSTEIFSYGIACLVGSFPVFRNWLIVDQSDTTTDSGISASGPFEYQVPSESVTIVADAFCAFV